MSDLLYPVLENKGAFVLNPFTYQGSCIGGGCEEKYKPRDIGKNESFDCTESLCRCCIFAADNGRISEALEWLVREGAITKDDALKFSLDGLGEKED